MKKTRHSEMVNAVRQLESGVSAEQVGQRAWYLEDISL